MHSANILPSMKTLQVKGVCGLVGFSDLYTKGPGWRWCNTDAPTVESRDKSLSRATLSRDLHRHETDFGKASERQQIQIYETLQEKMTIHERPFGGKMIL